MAGEAYPGAFADLDGDSEAVHRQLVSVARFHQQRTCEFAAWDFRVFGGLYCLCDGNPPTLAEFSSRDDRREAVRAHPGTCGVAQTDVIATQTAEQASLNSRKFCVYSNNNSCRRF